MPNAYPDIRQDACFRYTDKLGSTGEFRILRRYKARGAEFVDMVAIGDTRKRYEAELAQFKKNNGHLESVQSLTLEKFATNYAIEMPAWFNQRKIELLQGAVE